MKTFVMKCGCKLKHSELIQHKNKTYRCSKHPHNGIDYVESECDGGCGKIIIRHHGPYTDIKCDECKKRVRREKDKEYSYNKYIKQRSKRPEKKDLIINPNFDLSLYARGLSMYLSGGKSI